MKVYAFDIDNTLADTNREIMKRVAGFTESIFPFPLASDFFEMNPDVFAGAAAFDGAAEALQSLSRAGSMIIYVTARAPWFESLTRHWLRLNGFPEGRVICTSDKRSVIQEYKPVFMVEDSPYEIERVNDLVNVIVPAKPYNDGYDNRFETWATFPLIRSIA